MIKKFKYAGQSPPGGRPESTEAEKLLRARLEDVARLAAPGDLMEQVNCGLESACEKIEMDLGIPIREPSKGQISFRVENGCGNPLDESEVRSIYPVSYLALAMWEVVLWTLGNNKGIRRRNFYIKCRMAYQFATNQRGAVCNQRSAASEERAEKQSKVEIFSGEFFEFCKICASCMLPPLMRPKNNKALGRVLERLPKSNWKKKAAGRPRLRRGRIDVAREGETLVQILRSGYEAPDGYQCWLGDIVALPATIAEIVVENGAAKFIDRPSGSK